MKIQDEERLAIKLAIQIGDRYGFGNLICHLQSAWAAKLVEEYELPESTALKAATGSVPYPLKMHSDLINEGFWDETGERYKSA